jgi:hypothetical protein
MRNDASHANPRQDRLSGDTFTNSTAMHYSKDNAIPILCIGQQATLQTPRLSRKLTFRPYTRLHILDIIILIIRPRIFDHLVDTPLLERFLIILWLLPMLCARKAWKREGEHIR